MDRVNTSTLLTAPPRESGIILFADLPRGPREIAADTLVDRCVLIALEGSDAGLSAYAIASAIRLLVLLGWERVHLLNPIVHIHADRIDIQVSVGEWQGFIHVRADGSRTGVDMLELATHADAAMAGHTLEAFRAALHADVS